MENKQIIFELMSIKEKLIGRNYYSACFDLGLLVGVLTQDFPDVEHWIGNKEKIDNGS